MSNKKYDLAVYIGRFQPLHAAHTGCIQFGLDIADHLLILIGSASAAPEPMENPFTLQDRYEMIDQYLDTIDLNLQEGDGKDLPVSIEPIDDYLYNNNLWAASVQSVVFQHVERIKGDLDREIKVALIGGSKNEWYMSLFPTFEREVPKLHIDLGDHATSATEIRNAYFGEPSKQEMLSALATLPATTSEFLHKFVTTDEYFRLAEEYKKVKAIRAAWDSAPYPPTFVTTDAVVIQSGHILLIKRKHAPGKGLFALPGGYLEQSENIEDGMIRELREETRLKVPEPVIRGSIKAVKVFDHPKRSTRGRIITHAHLIQLKDENDLPKIHGSDDAYDAEWFPISELDHIKNRMFEDHYHIAQWAVFTQ